MQMGKTFFLALIILCIILSKKTLSEKNNSILSDLHIRKKRVLDRTLNGNRPMTLRQFPNVVSVHENGVYQCVGIILSAIFILTAAHCVTAQALIIIFSNSPSVDRGIPHNISHKIIHPNFRQYYLPNDLALIIISPPINFRTSRNEPIKLYNGNLPRNSHGTIIGWGAYRRRGMRFEFPHQLRSIEVPIIDLADCQHHYRERVEITGKYICTLYVNREKCCGPGDSGAPLIVHNRLVGVQVWTNHFENLIDPDVFMNLLNEEHREWILSYVPSAE